MITVPTNTHYALSDVLLDAAQAGLHGEIHAARHGFSASLRGSSSSTARAHQEIPTVDEMRQFHMKTLKQASGDLNFAETFFALRLVSNLSSHDREPFVHVWTSLADQGVGKVDLALKEKHLYEEKNPEVALQYHEDPAFRKSSTHIGLASEDELERYAQVGAFLKDIEDKRPYIKDGTVQIPLDGFVRDEGVLVSEYSHFTLFFPESRDKKTRVKAKSRPTRFSFEKTYPADASIHFQVHSNIGNSEGKMSYVLTGTGSIPLAEVAARVKEYLASTEHSSRRDMDKSLKMDESLQMDPIEIPLILNAVSSQEPGAKMVDTIERGARSGKKSEAEPMEPGARGEALYEGSLFLYVQVADPVTRQFFGSDLAFASPSVYDVTSGNFSHIAASMKMHVMRDMFPFIDNFTKGIATVTERDDRGKVVGKHPWAFQASLPEGKNIHAPFNKGNTHTLPGFTYYHDKGMQRLPSVPFILNTARIVLGRRGMSEEDFVRHANQPVLVLPKEPDGLSSPTLADDGGKEGSSGKRIVINPKFVHVLRIVGEIATAFPTSMSYRGDYADLNTDAVDNYEDIITDVDRIHRVEHISGITRRSAGRGSHTRYHRSWEETLKIGTEMFGDSMMDRSGDCEDDAKLISRMVAGMYSAKSDHPTIRSIQSVLHRYIPFSNLSSVTSASIRTAPDDGDGGSDGVSKHIGGAVVGSRQDLNAPIGAHMFSSLMNKQEMLRSIQKTSSKVEHLPDGSELSKAEQLEISEHVLHKTMWSISEHSSGKKAKENIGSRQSTRNGSGSVGSEDISEEERFVRSWCPPLILEGTGQSNALVNAVSSYYTRFQDKVDSINDTLLHVEAITRMVSGVSSKEVTDEDIRANQDVFAPFFMPIENNRLVDTSPDVRISPFYRMITEMYGIPAGHTDTRVTPHNLARSQLVYNRAVESSTSVGRHVHGLDMNVDFDGKEKPVDDTSTGIYGTGRALAMEGQDDSIYGLDRVIPVQLGPRKLADEHGHGYEHEEGIDGRNLTYGVNLTDFAHASQNVGIIRMIKTLPSEQKMINAVMKHSPPSMSMDLPPRAEMQKARRLAERYERMLMGLKQGEGSVVTRERYEEIPDRPITLFTRMDWVRDSHIRALGEHLAGNKYTERITVRPESFARGHHLMRITVYMIVAGTKQLYPDTGTFESNALAERLTSQRRMNEKLKEELERLLGQ
jgi:hypothetical protein